MVHRYKFTNRKTAPHETWKREGKAEWPNMLDLQIDRRYALELIATLARQVQAGLDVGEAPDAPIVLTMSGELVDDEDR